MNRPGAAPQPLRAMPGNVFANQPQSSNTARTGPMTSGRLQNGKIAGSGSTWSFGVNNTAGASGFANAQSRSTNNVGGFAQAIGGVGSQVHTPLDPSEFPSLSGAPQSQTQSSNAQAIWGSSGGIRSQQTSNSQRPQNQNHNQQNAHQTIRPPSQPSHPQPQQPQQQQQQHQQQQQQQQRQSEPQNDSHPSQFSPQGSNSVDEYRYGQDGLTRTNRNQEHQGSNEEFPPLGGLGTTGTQNVGSASYQSNQPLYRSATGAELPMYSQQTYQQNDNVTQRRSDAQIDGHSSQMSDVDQWGLPGLLETLKGPHRDQASLLLGMDLNELGLDLHRPDNTPLHSDWAGPFVDPSARPLIPDFTLPSSYTVHNVPPLHTKVGSFTDETLFVIFYQSPKDEAQEIAANELYQRDWRWHKKLQQWMMKAKEFGEPVVSLTRQEERGWYYFWDAQSWRKERREFILSYEHLHHGQAITSHNISSM